jgi:hypothetical protein
LRAYESKWLIEFLHHMVLLGRHQDVVYLQQSLVLAKLQVNDEPGARELLEHGIKTVPWLYCALFQELNLDAPPSVWGINADSDATSFWVKMYIKEAKDVWNNAQATSLLQQVAGSMGKVDTASLAVQEPAVDRGATRLAYLEGQTSLLAVAPRELLDVQPNYEFDPLPPPKEENIFTGEGTRLPWGRDEEQQGVRADADAFAARMQNLLARRGVAPGGEGALAPGPGMMGMMNNDDDDEDDEAIRALRAADDEELQRDIEAHVNWGSNDNTEQGILGTLMQMLGIGRRAQDEGGDQGDEGDEDEEEEEGLPGAWPEEDAR